MKRFFQIAALAATVTLAPVSAAMASTSAPAHSTATVRPAGTTAVQKPAYSNLYNYYLRSGSGASPNTYAASYWLYGGTKATAWNLAYVGTVTGGGSPFPYSNGGIDDNQAGLAVYEIFDEGNGYCWGLNGQAIEETSYCGTSYKNTLWVATPAPDGFSGWFGLENVGNTNSYDNYMTAQVWATNGKMSVNYQGSGNTSTTESQSFKLIAP